MTLKTKSQQPEIKLNKTSDFLLPLFGRPLIRYVPHLVNAYLSDPSLGITNPYYIYILIKFSGKMEYSSLEKWMYDHAQYRGHYDLLKSEFTMFIFELPEEYHQDYDLIVKGKYSEISANAKKLILANRSEQSAMPYILSKHEQLRGYWEDELGSRIPKHLDVWPIMVASEETFDKDLFIQSSPKKGVLKV